MLITIPILIAIVVLIVMISLSIITKKQAFAVRLFIVLFVFLMGSLGYVYVVSDANINDFSDMTDFSRVYFSWIGSAFENMKVLTSDAINMDWGTENKTS
ncbi:MAG: hypothetical protein ABIH49_02170 [archaeon]